MMAAKKVRWVRYVSPFGSPASMPEEQAERHLADDDARWLEFSKLGLLDERMRPIGPPRIEYPKEARRR